VIKDYLGMNIDLWNVGIWTRANSKAGKFVKKEPDYIPGGLSFSVSELNEARILGVLIRGSRWSGALGIMEKDRHGNIQRAMQIQMLNWQKKLYRSNPLGIEVALGYVAMYLIEWENLNLLAVGLASRMNSEDLLKRIISV
jgi:V/A-type H+-transporting ATPase subunit C